jgi:short-subunit dehydrogenase
LILKKNALKVVISGASSGLGLSLARYYLRRGAIVAVFARRSNLLHFLNLEFPNQVYCYPLDVRNTAEIQEAAHRFITNIGCPDIVIANAGVSVGTLTDHPEDIPSFQTVMDVNVVGMMNTFCPFVAEMVKRKKGTLVGISSIAGFRGLPGAGAYAASKAAAITYLESLRIELRKTGVKVVTICPGYIKTQMTVNNPFTMPFIMETDDAAERIAIVIKRQKPFAVVPWQMGIIMNILKTLPIYLYDRLLVNAPRKPRGTLK